MENHNGHIALLVMDMQTAILSNLPDHAGLVERLKQAIAYARERQIQVIFVRVGFRQGMPEISESNRGFAAVKVRMAALNMDDFLEIHPALTPAESEVVITKRRVSAFTGSDLEVVLRAFGISHLVLSGVSTSGVILSTLREAADKDYRLTVLADGCADGDEEVHHVLTTKVFTRQAEVLNIENWIH